MASSRNVMVVRERATYIVAVAPRCVQRIFFPFRGAFFPVLGMTSSSVGSFFACAVFCASLSGASGERYHASSGQDAIKSKVNNLDGLRDHRSPVLTQ